MAEHVASRRTYSFIWLALLVFTALTTGVAFIDIGVFNTVAALVIAGLKAVLIAIFFMHLTRSPVLTRVIVAGAIIWLLILILLVFTDYVTRGWVPVPGK